MTRSMDGAPSLNPISYLSDPRVPSSDQQHQPIPSSQQASKFPNHPITSSPQSNPFIALSLPQNNLSPAAYGSDAASSNANTLNMAVYLDPGDKAFGENSPKPPFFPNAPGNTSGLRMAQASGRTWGERDDPSECSIDLAVSFTIRGCI